MKSFVRLVFLSLSLCLASTGFVYAQQGPSRAQIADAVRQQKVIPGMDMQDVARAWGRPAGGKDYVSDTEGEFEVWLYARARVYFLDGVVKRVVLVRLR